MFLFSDIRLAMNRVRMNVRTGLCHGNLSYSSTEIQDEQKTRVGLWTSSKPGETRL